MAVKKTDKFTENERIKMVHDKVDDILAAVDEFTKSRVYVGVPEGSDDRGEDIGNAALAYIHNYGSFRARIPARPFMEPGIEEAKKIIEVEFMAGAKAAMDGERKKAIGHLAIAGGAAASAIKNVIRRGIPPPLKESTVRSRHRQRGTKAHVSELLYGDRIAAGVPASYLIESVTPLINTGKLLASITFVLSHDKF